MTVYASFWNSKGKIEPTGVSKDKKHRGWFDVHMIDMDEARRSAPRSGGGSGVNRRHPGNRHPGNTVHLELRQTPSAIELVMKFARRAVIPLMRIDFTENGKSFMGIELREVILTSYRQAGPEDGATSRTSTVVFSGMYSESKTIEHGPKKGKATRFGR